MSPPPGRRPPVRDPRVPTSPREPGSPAAPDPSLIAADLPLLLLPVRLETRFMETAAGVDLLVRIYPDDIHIDSHEPDLTDDERSWGERYWLEAHASSGNEPGAWAQLCDRYGPERSAWIAVATSGAVPSPGTRRSAWTRAPRTTVLPDRWTALGYVGSTLIFAVDGQSVPDPLATGPDPSVAEDAPSSADIAFDDAALWLVDFERAVQVGMGLRIALPAEARNGLDRLIVLGVKSSLNAVASADRLAALFEAHHYATGIAFVAPGTPTNNTAAGPSGFRRERAAAASHAIERGPALVGPGDGSDAAALARALGISVGLFEHVDGADRQADVGRHMNTALWRSTIGYFLEQMMSDRGQTFAAETLDQIRRRFINHVRAGGPLPAIRVGRQPYGVLPVVSVDQLAAAGLAGVEGHFIRLVGVLRDAWRRSLPQAPRLGRTPADPDRDFIDVLSMEPLSSSFEARPVFGIEYARRLGLLFGRPFDDGYTTQVMEALAALGLAWTPRLARVLFGPRSAPLSGALVQAPGDTGAPIAPNYIEWLARATLEELRGETGITPRPDALLYLLLRHSLLLEYADAASRVRASRERFDRAALFESELVAIEDAAEVPTVRRLIDASLAGRVEPLGRLLDPPGPLPAEAAQLGEIRESLTALAGKTAGELDRLTRETLDACAFRLDAWITSLATDRLDRLRGGAPQNVYIGGYGWVEDLRAAPPSPLVPAPADEPPGNVKTSQDSAGFVHAPSLAHAVTSAVLRSAYTSHDEAGDRDALSVDLRSVRVRRALWLLEGVRQGQPLGALIGYRLERALHERRLDRYIAPLRRLAPTVVSTVVVAGTGDPLAARAVVDGLVLHTRFKSGAVPWGADGLPQLGTDDQVILTRELGALEDAVDAIGDLGLAESIHQIVQGNPVRAGAILDAIARGETPPAEFEVVKTPRSGVGLTHRLLVLFSGAARRPAHWTIDDRHARAKAEPRLTEWASELIGDPHQIRCRAILRYTDPATGSPRTWPDQPRPVTLADLQISPLDVVFTAAGSGAVQGASELEQRVIYHLRCAAPVEVPTDASVELRFAPENPSETGFADALELARALRDALASARAADARDVAPPEAGPESHSDEDELRRRADGAVGHLHDVVRRLAEARAEGDVERLRDALLEASLFGAAGSIPVSGKGDDDATRAALVGQAAAVGFDLARREAAVSAVESASPASRIDAELARLAAVFGRDFKALPVFRPPNARELARAFEASDELQGADPWSVVTWFHRTSRVREAVARLDLAFTYADALAGQAPARLSVAQLPYSDGDHWLALALPSSDSEAPGGRLSLVAHLRGELTSRATLAGLVFDEWLEVIPRRTETTGLAFHYDQPGAQAPQALLIAVPVEGQNVWTRNTLASVLLETLELAKLRVVDADALVEGGHILPALYFALNLSGDTVSTDFRRAAPRR